MTLELPNVTLVAVETMSHDLMQIALEDCVAKVNFGGGIVIYTDQPSRFDIPGSDIHTVPHWPSKKRRELSTMVKPLRSSLRRTL